MKKLLPIALLCISGLFATAQEITLEPYASGFTRPVDLKHAGDERLFIVEQGGTVKVIDGSGTTLPDNFLDISSQVSGSNEQGLLSIAFHPDYANNGLFYVNYTKNNGDTRVSQFSVDPNNPNVALSGSEETIIEYIQPASNHNGGCLQFGSDGFLYIASGDGGGAGGPDMNSNAQNNSLLLGKLLRIDVDNPISGGTNYGIPADNPFAGSTTERQEIWANGLRNPWKFSFDSDNGDIWIGDVGQNNIEEIDRAGGNEAALNYGWRCYEGSDVYEPGVCTDPSILEFPIAEYSSAGGSGNCSITGGYVYRGSMYADIQGVYIFADYCGGFIGTVDQSGNMIDQGDFSENWVSFGEDISGEIYAVAQGGSIHKVQGGEILSVSENDENTFTFFPNPADNRLTIQLSNDSISSITVSDIKGSILFSEDNINTLQKDISVASLANGIYLLKVTTETNNTFIKKLVVK